ncbi:uncharacterized protein [Callorhinus ursinus]|uniref:uncharacterized protein n=1 Tax=Callorhinus ursinus TaxID=34884 RepID=UPI003CD025CA
MLLQKPYRITRIATKTLGKKQNEYSYPYEMFIYEQTIRLVKLKIQKGTCQSSVSAAQGLAEVPGAQPSEWGSRRDHSVKKKSCGGRQYKTARSPQSRSAFLILASLTHTHRPGFCSIKLGAAIVSSVAPQGPPSRPRSPRCSASLAGGASPPLAKVWTGTGLRLSNTAASDKSGPHFPNVGPSLAPKDTSGIRRNPKAETETAGRRDKHTRKLRDPARSRPRPPAPPPAPPRRAAHARLPADPEADRAEQRERSGERVSIFLVRAAGALFRPLLHAQFRGSPGKVKPLNPLVPLAGRSFLSPLAASPDDVPSPVARCGTRESAIPVKIALRRVRAPASLPSAPVDSDRAAGRFPAQSLSRTPAPAATRVGTGPPPYGGCRPFAPLQGGQGGDRDGGQEAGVCGVRGRQKVWAERTAGIETGCRRLGSKCRRRKSEGGRQKDAETGKPRWTKGEKRNKDKETDTENKTHSGLGEGAGPKPRCWEDGLD